MRAVSGWKRSGSRLAKSGAGRAAGLLASIRRFGIRARSHDLIEMKIADNNLLEVIRTLPGKERRAIEECLLTDRNHTASAVLREALRRIKRRLKRKARSKLPRKLIWLE